MTDNTGRCQRCGRGFWSFDQLVKHQMQTGHYKERHDEGNVHPNGEPSVSGSKS